MTHSVSLAGYLLWRTIAGPTLIETEPSSSVGGKDCNRRHRRRGSRQDGAHRSSFGNSPDAHPIEHLLLLRHEDPTASKKKLLQALDGGRWIEPETGFHGRPRLIEAAEMRERRGECEMRHREIAVGLDRSPEPPARFFIRAEQELCVASLVHPEKTLPRFTNC
ncbi:MAG TPA: hypothetical protein VL976_03310 [Xanthobacteraceae bacterium]|nr:hypothetical protein [Xanthobacteraceae bacterium]